jgi:hypothetical protein
MWVSVDLSGISALLIGLSRGIAQLRITPLSGLYLRHLCMSRLFTASSSHTSTDHPSFIYFTFSKIRRVQQIWGQSYPLGGTAAYPGKLLLGGPSHQIGEVSHQVLLAGLSARLSISCYLDSSLPAPHRWRHLRSYISIKPIKIRSDVNAEEKARRGACRSSKRRERRGRRVRSGSFSIYKWEFVKCLLAKVSTKILLILRRELKLNTMFAL